MVVAQESTASINDVATFWVRVFSWAMLAVLAVFLVNNYLVTTKDWPGILPVFQAGTAGSLAWIPFAAYFVGLAVAGFFVASHRKLTPGAGIPLISGPFLIPI